MTEENEPRKRRVRYQGTHPRHYKEKYKELNPDQYSDDVKRVLDRRQTPAGTHVPICVEEILEILKPRPGEIGLDATLGFGGHATKILEKIMPGGCLYGIDVDPIELPNTITRIKNAGYDATQFNARQLNFAGILKLLNETDGFDFILADLGVSSMQMDNPERGFTFKFEGPLDLRLNPTRGISAAQLLKKSSIKMLTEMLDENADEPYAIEIAETLFKNRENIETTSQLSDFIKKSLSEKVPFLEPEAVKKSLQRSFQAFRIAVNDEFGALDQFLKNLPWCIKPHGRIAVLTFHSGEDRRVITSFEEGLKKGIYKSISPTPIRPSGEEQYLNPRSTSARLRLAIASENISDIMNGV
jgi:16S rRNA (cytosine1402-N4)-methyltransferase